MPLYDHESTGQYDYDLRAAKAISALEQLNYQAKKALERMLMVAADPRATKKEGRCQVGWPNNYSGEFYYLSEAASKADAAMTAAFNYHVGRVHAEEDAKREEEAGK